MKKQSYLDMFIEDCKYYDPDQKEVKTILKHIDLKGKTILDVGAGIGRLAFPLAKYAKEVVAIDQDHRLSPYWKLHERKNVIFVNTPAEQYLKNRRKFDVILLAWPTLDFRIFSSLKKAMHEKSFFILLMCADDSDFESVVDKIGIVRKGHFNKFLQKKKNFLQRLSQHFQILHKEKIITSYQYPDEHVAFRILKNGFKMWYALTLHNKAKENLKKIIYSHKQGKKIFFQEEVWFYLFKHAG
jgi:ubiquinone/menaquinone biosynthesis C-methylase UbiE